jgi:hypothetical protein
MGEKKMFGRTDPEDQGVTGISHLAQLDRPPAGCSWNRDGRGCVTLAPIPWRPLSGCRLPGFNTCN